MSLNLALVVNRQSGEGQSFYVDSPIPSTAQKELDLRRCNGDVRFVTVIEHHKAKQFEEPNGFNEFPREVIRLAAQITFQHCLAMERSTDK